MNIASRFFDLCFFKIGPEDMPSSTGILKLTLFIYFVLGVIISRIDSSWNESLLTSLTDLVYMSVAVGFLLNIKKHQIRYQQTLMAMAGAGICLGIISYPIVFWLHQIDEQQQATSVAMMLLMAVVIWSVLIVVHIFQKALEIKHRTAVMLTIIYIMLSLVVLGLTLSGVA